MKQRFNCYKSQGFGLEVLKVEEGLHKHIIALELSLHRKYRKYHYTPLVKFRGSVQECYSLEILEEIKNG
ncbi:hypothetical protein NVP1063O_228 [Vibrio phage 1.063.O._10N.261.45.C7]|nr:hypothetical protein NVP1063O_228 [Vibrio phage 1.063.O._10N.261.45.C7]